MPDRVEIDVLGPPYERHTIDLGSDDEGAVIATLVRRRADRPTRRAVLYVHGFVDYFFQTHLAEAWDGFGYEFYALDLRGYGRSLSPHQLPNYCTDLAVYAEELDRAVHVLRDELGHTTVVGHGHSTGALLLTLWAHARRGRTAGPVVDALVLNSPWLDLNRPWFDRVVTTRLVDVIGRVAPRVVVGRLDPSYGRYLCDPGGGGWTYDQRWKPVDGFPVRAGWLRSIRRGHAAVARGLGVDVPVLVCTSDATGPCDRPHDALDRTDSVLRVEHMLERAPRIGPDVTVEQVPGGVHDLALSRPGPRAAYFGTIGDWLSRRLPGEA